MQRTAQAVVAAIVVAACQYNGRPMEGTDGAIDRPDGVPGQPDADLTMPDAPVIPDAPPGTPDAPPDQPDAFVPMCPASYAAVGGGHYRWVSTSTNWLTAEFDCEDDATGGEIPTHLAVVDDATERSLLVSGSGTTLDNQWLGLADLASEGSPIYITPQASVDPPNGITGNVAMKDCVRLQTGGTYDIRDCAQSNRYVCECDGFTADPARFPNYPNGN